METKRYPHLIFTLPLHCHCLCLSWTDSLYLPVTSWAGRHLLFFFFISVFLASLKDSEVSCQSPFPSAPPALPCPTGPPHSALHCPGCLLFEGRVLVCHHLLAMWNLMWSCRVTSVRQGLLENIWLCGHTLRNFITASSSKCWCKGCEKPPCSEVK